MSEEKKIGITRRQFLRDAGIVVGSTAVGSVFLLSACDKGEEVTKTVTTTAPGTTNTVTTTAPGATVTASGSTQTVTKYTCPVCSKEFDSLNALKTHFDAEHLGGSESASNFITLDVNGDTFGIVIEPHWTLQYVLHDKLQLTGTKDSCNHGGCGHCSVNVDGKLVLACMMLAIEANGKEITTIEGLADGETLHPLQQAFWELGAVQCGHCAPGMIMTAKTWLEQNPNPTKEGVREAISGVYCRCTGYYKAMEAVLAANAKMRGS